MILLDTCALIDLISEAPSLSPKTLELINKKSILLSVSIAEIECKVAANKLLLSITTDRLLQELIQIAHFHIQDITAELWLKAIRLSWIQEGKIHKDPADRLMVAYAESLQIPIVTTDGFMKKRYPHCIW